MDKCKTSTVNPSFSHLLLPIRSPPLHPATRNKRQIKIEFHLVILSLIFQSIVHSTAIRVVVIQLSITLRLSSNADPNPYKSTNPKLFSKTLRCKITITTILSICPCPGGGQPDSNHSPTMLNTYPSVITWSKSINFIL